MQIYNKVTKKFLNLVFEKYADVKLSDKGDLFNWLMINEDTEVLRKLGKFVQTCFKIRFKLVGK